MLLLILPRRKTNRVRYTPQFIVIWYVHWKLPLWPDGAPVSITLCDELTCGFPDSDAENVQAIVDVRLLWICVAMAGQKRNPLAHSQRFFFETIILTQLTANPGTTTTEAIVNRAFRSKRSR